MVSIPASEGGIEYAAHGEIRFGGAESNVAICASRLGTSTAWIGRIGDDAFGRRITRALRGERIAVHDVVDAVAPTALMLKDHPIPGRTRVSYYRRSGAGSNLSPADLPLEIIRNADVLHVTGITLALSETARESVFAAVHCARDAGVKVSFDVNHRSKLWSAEQAADVYRDLAALSDIVFAGTDEAEILVGKAKPAQLADSLRALGPDQAVIKLGADGALGIDHATTLTQPAVPVQVVDSVGAGDAFVAGYLAELIEGSPLATRLETGAACGAYVCLGSGDWELMPSRSDLRDFLGAAGDPVDR